MIFRGTTQEFEAKSSGFQGAAGATAIADGNRRPGNLSIFTESKCYELGVPFFDDGSSDGVTEKNFRNVAAGAVIVREQKPPKCPIVSKGKGQQDVIREVSYGEDIVGLAGGKPVGREDGGFPGFSAAGYGPKEGAYYDKNRKKR